MESKQHYTAVFEEAEEGGFIAFINEIPGVNTQGETLEEAKTNLLEAFNLFIETKNSLPNSHKK